MDSREEVCKDKTDVLTLLPKKRQVHLLAVTLFDPNFYCFLSVYEKCIIVVVVVVIILQVSLFQITQKIKKGRLTSYPY